MGTLFGTDGIRGRANAYPVTPEVAINVGRAVATIFKSDTKSKIVVGKDGRISGDMLEHAIASGICSMGGNAYLAGILPTPGVAFTTSSMGANAGIVISASHNPYYDNGIKIFNGDGYKLSDEKEAEIEQLILDERLISADESMIDTGRVFKIDDAGNRYGNFLDKTLSEENYFRGLKVVMDCSNGATSEVAPSVFSALGADVDALFVNPDGKNINDNCGSQHPEVLQKNVVESGADIGVAFDGTSIWITNSGSNNVSDAVRPGVSYSGASTSTNRAMTVITARYKKIRFIKRPSPGVCDAHARTPTQR